MPLFFSDDDTKFEAIEKFYAPPGINDPNIDDEITGSSNHANVFNKRLQTLADRTAFLRKFFTQGLLFQLLNLSNSSNKILGFDSGGSLTTYDFSISLGTVRFSVLPATANPFQDELGFWWFIPNGTALSPAQPRYERLYKAVWASMDTSQIVGGKGASADADWTAGKNINYPDCRDDYVHVASTNSTRLLNRVFGSRQINLVPENYRHRHNLSLQGFTAGSISVQQGSTSNTVFNAIPFGIQPAGTSRQNVAGNRVNADDSGGAVWENTANAATPVDINPPGISLTMLIYLGQNS